MDNKMNSDRVNNAMLTEELQKIKYRIEGLIPIVKETDKLASIVDDVDVSFYIQIFRYSLERMTEIINEREEKYKEN